MTEKQQDILERTLKLIERLREFRDCCAAAKAFQLASVLKYHIEELERMVLSQKMEWDYLPPNWNQDDKDLVIW